METSATMPEEAIFLELKSLAHPRTEVDFRKLLLTLTLFFLSFQPSVSGEYLFLETKLRLFEMGAYRFLFRELLPRVRDHAEVEALIWCFIRDAVGMRDTGNPLEYEPVDLAVELGLFEIIIAELNRTPPNRPILINAFSALTTICLSAEKYAPRFIESGLIDACLKIFRQDIATEISTSALGSLKNLSMAAYSHPFLIKAGAADIAAEKIELLGAVNSIEQKLGVCAASLLCRLSNGNPRSVAGRILLYSKTRSGQSVWTMLGNRLRFLLRRVLEQGPQGAVLGSAWNPANIVLDVAILCELETESCTCLITLDESMMAFLQLVLDSIENRGLPSPGQQGNFRLIHYGLLFIKRMAIAAEQQRLLYKNELVRQSRRLLSLMHSIIRGDEVDLQTYQDAQTLVTLIGRLRAEAVADEEAKPAVAEYDLPVKVLSKGDID